MLPLFDRVHICLSQFEDSHLSNSNLTWIDVDFGNLYHKLGNCFYVLDMQLESVSIPCWCIVHSNQRVLGCLFNNVLNIDK